MTARRACSRRCAGGCGPCGGNGRGPAPGRLAGTLWLEPKPRNPKDPTLADQITEQLIRHTAPAPAGQPPTYLDQVREQAAALGRCEDAVDSARQALAGTLGGDLRVRELALPGYHVPGDPVLVVTGLGRSTDLDPAGLPVCRLPAQLLAGPAEPPLPDPHHLLPDEIQDLHQEAVALWLGPPPGAERGAGAPFPPAPRQSWTQPWVPLILEWQVRVIAGPDYQNHPADTALLRWTGRDWAFDGTDAVPGDRAGELAGLGDSGTPSLLLTGRTLLTPQTSLTLADQLDDWLASHSARNPAFGDLPDLAAFLRQLGQQDILSQRLSGLRALLIERDYATSATPAPGGDVGQALGPTVPRGAPYPAADQRRPALTFLPLAGTFFTIEQLRVTDFMGRTSDLLLANGGGNPQAPGHDEEQYFIPLPGRGLRSPTALQPPRGGTGAARACPFSVAERMLQLPPRLAQGAQVSLRLITADDRHEDITCVPGGNPVCGWVVPNHLDRSLAFYSPGHAWGELRLAGHADGPGTSYTVTWQRDPVDRDAPGGADKIPNQSVADWLTALTAGPVAEQQAPGDRFADVLEAIDEALWNVDPRGARKDQALSVLVGRPLAIVRAELTLRVACCSRPARTGGTRSASRSRPAPSRRPARPTAAWPATSGRCGSATPRCATTG